MRYLFGFLTLFLFSCKKDDCYQYKKQPLKIIAPLQVYEREDIPLKVGNFYDLGVNSYYGWMFPDMTPHPQTTGVGVEVNPNNLSRSIYNATMEDEGEYKFSAVAGCGTFAASQYIKVLPLHNPCFDSVSHNTIYVRDSFTGVSESYGSIVTVHETDGQIKFTINNPTHLYTIRINLQTVPNKNRTYYLRNLYESSSVETMNFDKYTEAYINFTGGNAAYNAYEVTLKAEDLYVFREGNNLIFTLCHVKFRSANTIKIVSAKIIVVL